MTLPLVRLRTPPVFTTGALPPMLLRIRFASVLLPKRVSVEGPLRVTVFPGAIWPLLLVIVTVALFNTSPPVGTTATPPVLLSASVTLLRTVPPE